MLKSNDVKLKELSKELRIANQLKEMYRLYYKAKHDDIEGLLFKYKKTIEKIKSICEPILEVTNIEKLGGKHLTGKYNLAKEIMEVISNEENSKNSI